MKKLFTLLLFISAIRASIAQSVPTWADNVACILYTRCTSCHHTNGIAPFPLMNYTDAQSHAYLIDQNVSQRVMPPWPPDFTYQTYAHERVLSQEEIDVITAWYNGGSQQGNISNAPAPPVYNGLAQISSPDLSVIMQTYTVPVVTSDLYRCFVIPNVTFINKFITAMEVLPGNNSIVHHVLVYADTAQTCINLDAADPDPGYTSFGGIGSNTAMLIGAWVPGAQPYYLPQNMGISLPANSHIIMQVHYPLGSTGQTDSTRINMILTTNPATRNVYIAPILNHSTNLINGPLHIPANTIQTFNEEFTLPFDATILAVAPHMHLIGRSIISYSVSNVGDTTKFINLPNWQFHWQGAYFFRRPLKIPAFSTLYASANYDNTVNNPFNPNIPPIDVNLGENTTDEMMLVFFYFLFYQPGDENIAIDTATTVQTFNNCNFSLGINNNPPPVNEVSVYPNPASGTVTFTLPPNATFTVTVYDLAGKAVAICNDRQGLIKFDGRKISAGSYIVEAANDELILRKRFEVLKD